MVRPVNPHSTKEQNFSTYHVNIESQKYIERISGVIAKSAMQLDAQKKSANFEPSESISKPSFLQDFKTVCDRNRIHESAALWYFQHFVKGAC